MGTDCVRMSDKFYDRKLRSKSTDTKDRRDRANKRKEEFYRYLAAVSSDVWIDREGNVYDKYTGADINVQSMFDADTCTTELRGYRDNEGNAIDIVGNLKY